MKDEKKISAGGLLIVACVSGIILISTSFGISGTKPPEAKKQKSSLISGIAANYAQDVGIAGDSTVIFTDDFESWKGDGTKKPDDKWTGLRVNKSGRVRAAAGSVTIDDKKCRGERILEIANWHTGNAGGGAGGISIHLGNYASSNEGLGDGYEDIYVRYYLKFYEYYKAVRNHGANLGGRDVTQRGARWVGQANTPDVAAHGYFFSGVQPRGPRGSRDIHLGFYSYHMDKKGPWGDGYDFIRKIPIEPGRWYCVERHMKLNSVNPVKADGLEELWIDGELSVRQEGLRFRKVPQLKINFFSLENYYHGLPEEYTRENPVRVYFDNVVIAHKYIGPMGSEGKCSGTAGHK
ncbi:MAG: polysaccharide lyase [Planctomycetota bacterium]|jgi:hypothetical protein